MIELELQPQLFLVAFQVKDAEMQLQVSESTLALVRAVELMQEKQVKVVPKGTITELLPQSQYPAVFQVKFVMLQLQLLF
jgi:hypothetical protein